MLHNFVLLLLAQAVDTTPQAPGEGLYFLLWCALVAAGTAVAAAATWFIAQKAKQSKGWQALAIIWEQVQSVVAHAEVHIRPKIKAALSDGNLSAAEASEIKAEVMKLVKEGVAPALLAAAQSFLHMTAPAFEVHLSGMIERALGLQRAAGTLPPPAPGSVAVVPTTPR